MWVATLVGDALVGHPLNLLVRFFRKVRCVVLTTGVRIWLDVWMWTRWEEYVRIVAGWRSVVSAYSHGKKESVYYVILNNNFITHLTRLSPPWYWYPRPLYPPFTPAVFVYCGVALAPSTASASINTRILVWNESLIGYGNDKFKLKRFISIWLACWSSG